MEKVTFEKWDMADDIETKEDVGIYLEGALEDNDPDFLLQTMGYILRSKGMVQVAGEPNYDRKGFQETLSPEGKPTLKTVFMLLDILGLQIRVEQKSA